jgi:hypothetical protein
MLAMAYSVRFDLLRAGSINNSTGEDDVVGVKSCTKRKRIALSYYCPLASHDKIRPRSYRMDCSTQPEESGNKDYDDHDADDVKNVHCILRLRHARLQYESTMLQ